MRMGREWEMKLLNLLQKGVNFGKKAVYWIL